MKRVERVAGTACDPRSGVERDPPKHRSVQPEDKVSTCPVEFLLRDSKCCGARPKALGLNTTS